MTQELILFIITTVITVILGIIGYFLKRTMDRNDKNEMAVQELRDNLLTLSDKYATKAEIREIKASMENCRRTSTTSRNTPPRTRILSAPWQGWKARSTAIAASKEERHWSRQK